MRGVVLGVLCGCGFAFGASADLSERFYDEDPSVKAEIEACAPTIADCAILMGEGLAYGMAGWPEDVAAAIRVLEPVAETGSTDAMSMLAYIYEDEDMSVYDMDKATVWYGRAAMSADDGIIRGIQAMEFLNLGFEQATKFQDWKRIKLGDPRKRKATVMGYMLDDKPPVLQPDEANDFSKARKAYAALAMSDYDVWTILTLTAQDHPAAMRLYGEMVREGYMFEQNPEVADAFLLAARTWD